MVTSTSVPGRSTLGILAIAASICLVILNWRAPFVRLEPAILNSLVFGVVCLSPWLAAFLVRAFPQRATRIVLRTVWVACGIALLPLAIMSLSAPGFTADLGTIYTGRYIIKLYETDCGAVCSVGVAVRQQRRLMPGIILVRDLNGFYPAFSPTYTVINQDSIRIDVPPYAGRIPARSRAYRLHDLP